MQKLWQNSQNLNRKRVRGDSEEISKIYSTLPCKTDTFGYGAHHSDIMLKMVWYRYRKCILLKQYYTWQIAEYGRGLYAFITGKEDVIVTFGEMLGAMLAELFKNKSQKITHAYIHWTNSWKCPLCSSIMAAKTTMWCPIICTLDLRVVCQIYDKYFDGLCDMIVSTNNSAKQMKINYRTNLQPTFGIIQLIFSEQFLDLLFIHLAMLFRCRILKHLCENSVSFWP